MRINPILSVVFWAVIGLLLVWLATEALASYLGV